MANTRSLPVVKPVADINLEQVGRTDDDEGPQVGTATMTGLDYSDIGAIFQAAGQALGVNVYKHPKNSDAYFSRSDNQSLANQGARAYARRGVLVSGLSRRRRPLGQIDYTNMEKVDRVVALGIYRIAQNSVAPRRNSANPKPAKYLEAWKRITPNDGTVSARSILSGAV